MILKKQLQNLPLRGSLLILFRRWMAWFDSCNLKAWTTTLQKEPSYAEEIKTAASKARITCWSELGLKSGLRRIDLFKIKCYRGPNLEDGYCSHSSSNLTAVIPLHYPK